MSQFSVSVASKFFVLVVTISAATISRANNVFHYKMYGVAPIAGISCDEFAWQTGQRLAEYTTRGPGAVQVIDTGCFSDIVDRNSNSWNVDVAYESETPLNRITTSDFTVAVHGAPTYKTAEECQAALEGEIPFFEQKTGLQIFTSWCRVPSYTRGWELVIEAFGDPEIRPYLAGASIFGRIMGHDMASFSAVITERFAAQGAEVVQMDLRSNFAYFDLQVRYYGRESIRMYESAAVKTRTIEECTAQLQRFDDNLIANGIVNYGTFCTKGSLGDSFELMSLTHTRESIRLSHPDESFADFVACDAQRDTIAERYRSRYGRNVIDAVCGYNRDVRAYKVVVVDKPVQADL